ncbi:hypothetical protein GmHk_20G057031 [Glycine max]|nr:hypothetical protein GmHk_20G057031 [Glycine max]
MMIQQKVEDKLWEPVKICPQAPPISHLFFTDDCLLFTKATPKDDFTIRVGKGDVSLWFDKWLEEGCLGGSVDVINNIQDSQKLPSTSLRQSHSIIALPPLHRHHVAFSTKSLSSIHTLEPPTDPRECTIQDM